MSRLGGSLIILGILAFAYQAMNMELAILQAFSLETQRLIGGGMIGVGLFFALIGAAVEHGPSFE